MKILLKIFFEINKIDLFYNYILKYFTIKYIKYKIY